MVKNDFIEYLTCAMKLSDLIKVGKGNIELAERTRQNLNILWKKLSEKKQKAAKDFAVAIGL